jgi:hypothetical protein
MKLDEVIPDPHYRMGHSRSVGAPPTLVWDELCRVPMSALPLGRALEGVRLLPARVSGRQRRSLAGVPFSRSRPFRCCSPSDPGRDGGRPQPGVAPAGRIDPAPAGCGGAASLVATGMDQGRDGVPPRTHPAGTLLRTETRVLAMDPRTRRVFAAYWWFIRAGSGAIRREVLRVVRPPRGVGTQGALTRGRTGTVGAGHCGGSWRELAREGHLAGPRPRYLGLATLVRALGGVPLDTLPGLGPCLA